MRELVATAFLAGMVVSCRSPLEPSVDRPNAAWPNEPAGFSASADQGWNAVVEGSWQRRASSEDRIVADPAAPTSPANVLEYLYPPGFRGGSAPATHFHPLGRRKEIFVGLQWKVSDPWQGHSSGVNKVQFIYLDGSKDVAMVMHGPRSGPYELRVLPQWPEHSGSWLTGNIEERRVALGRWHRVEWHLKYESRYGAGDGIIRWWLDGALLGSYSNVRFPDDGGFIEYQMSPTWGGVGDTKTQGDYFRFDHTYISFPAEGDAADR